MTALDGRVGRLQVRLPDPDTLPDDAAKLVREFKDLRAKLVATKQERVQLESRDGIRDARNRDDADAAEAIRTGTEPPTETHEQQRAARIAELLTTEDRYNAAAVTTANEIQQALSDAAPAQRAAALERFEARRAEFHQVLAELGTAYQALKDSVEDVAYWLKVENTGHINYPEMGRDTRDRIEVGDRTVQLTPFHKITSLIDQNDRSLGRAAAEAHNSRHTNR